MHTPADLEARARAAAFARPGEAPAPPLTDADLAAVEGRYAGTVLEPTIRQLTGEIRRLRAVVADLARTCAEKEVQLMEADRAIFVSGNAPALLADAQAKIERQRAELAKLYQRAESLQYERDKLREGREGGQPT